MIRLAPRQWGLERDRPPVVLKPKLTPARRRQDLLDPTERAQWVVRDLFDPGDAPRRDLAAPPPIPGAGAPRSSG